MSSSFENSLGFSPEAPPSLTVAARSRHLGPAAIFLLSLAGLATTSSAEIPLTASLLGNAPPVTEVPLGTSPEEERFDLAGQNLVARPGGGWAAVWSVGSFSDKDVYMQWIAPDGQVLLEEGGRIVAGQVGVVERFETVAAHASEGVFVAFVREEGGPSGNKVFVQSFDGDGEPRWVSGGVQAMAHDQNEVLPHLVADRQGGVFVCAQLGGSEGIWCQHLDADGQRSWPAEGLLAGDRPGRRILPRGVLGAGNDLLVFWRNQRDFSDGVEEPMLMEGQRFGLDGTRHWGTSGLLVKTTDLPEADGSSFNFFDVVTDGAGGAVVVFEDLAATPNLDVLAQRITPDGALPWAASPQGAAVVTATAAETAHDATAAGPSGGIFVAVREFVPGGGSHLKLFRLGPDGGHLWPTAGLFLSDSEPSTHNFDSSGFFQDGVLRWAWTHQLEPGSPVIDLYMSRFLADGQRLDPAPGAPLTTAVGVQLLGHIEFSAEAGSFLAAWDDRRVSPGSDVYGGLVPLQAIFFDGFESGDLSMWSSEP